MISTAARRSSLTSRAEDFQEAGVPQISSAFSTLLPGGSSLVTLEGTGFDWSEGFADVSAIVRFGTRDIELRNVTFSPGDNGKTIVNFLVPNTILLGSSEIFIRRPSEGSLRNGNGVLVPSTQYLFSAGIKVDNKAGYAFAGDSTGVQVIDRKLPFEANQEVDELIHRINLGAAVNEIVVTGDLGAAFVATTRGVAVIDTLSLQQFDADPDDGRDRHDRGSRRCGDSACCRCCQPHSLHRRAGQTVHRQHRSRQGQLHEGRPLGEHGARHVCRKPERALWQDYQHGAECRWHAALCRCAGFRRCSASAPGS